MKLFNDDDLLLDKMSAKGDPLERLNQVIRWESFRPVLQKIFKEKRKDPSKGGRPPYDYVMMFKILIIQRYNNLSDDAMEYMMLDRLSFRRFLGIDDKQIPDAKTIWLYRDKLAQSGKGNELFIRFSETLNQEGLIAHEGQIVDASFVEAPKQRNSREENLQIKQGEVPEGWSEHKKAQKDTDARWTIKGNERHYGYKDHVCVDAKSKLITNYQATPAQVNDSQVDGVLCSPDEWVYNDSAYVNQPLPKGCVAKTCERAYRGHPLSDVQKAVNHFFSHTRSRVEHVFGFIENSMNGSTLRSIGFKRAVVNIDLTNLCYNLFRYEQIKRLGLMTRA
jgi:IS5 family transposase